MGLVLGKWNFLLDGSVIASTGDGSIGAVSLDYCKEWLQPVEIGSDECISVVVAGPPQDRRAGLTVMRRWPKKDRSIT